MYFELPLLDAPFNVRGGVWFPSMRQSLALSAALYEGTHTGIEAALFWVRNGYVRMGLTVGLSGALDVLLGMLPLGEGSNHEEFHRAVLAQRGIRSFNEYYTFPIGAPFVAVDHVADADLSRLRSEHPAEFVRLSTAGLEGNAALARTLEAHRFFLDTRATFGAALALNIGMPLLYLSTCGSLDGDRQTMQIEAQEGTNVAARDFTGLDCNAWAYDLFRPGEPYEARGVHPSGVGVRRYRLAQDLTEPQLAYLRLQFPLNFLNLLNPFLIGFNGFRTRSPFSGQPMRVTGNLAHTLTPFGFVVDANVYWHEPRANVLATVHSYFAGYTYLPGLEVSLVRLPVFGAGTPWLFTMRAGLWLQPRNLLITDAPLPGGILTMRATYSWRGWLEFWGELEGKTRGWVAAVEPLDAAVTARVGLSALLPGPAPLGP